MNQPTRRIIKKGRVQVGSTTTTPVAGAQAAPAKAPGPAPEITLHRDGDDIQAIEVTCGCGKTIIIECEYSEDTQS